MTWTKFLISSFLVVTLTFAKSQITKYWVPIEFSYFLLFWIIREAPPVRALFFTFLLSMGLDFLFQVQQIRGLSCLGQLLLVFLLVNFRKQVIQDYLDSFFVILFPVFFVADHYILRGMSHLLGVPILSVPFLNLLFFAAVHTALFGLFVNLSYRLGRKRT